MPHSKPLYCVSTLTVLSPFERKTLNTILPIKHTFRIVGYGISGCDPKVMGIGPVPAIRAMMAKTGKSLADVDQLEINEAFGAQALSCLKELDAVPMDKG